MRRYLVKWARRIFPSAAWHSFVLWAQRIDARANRGIGNLEARQVHRPRVGEDFLSDSFHGDRSAVAAALPAVLGPPARPVRLVGPDEAVAHLAEGLRASGHAIHHVRWSYGDPIPAGGFGDAILCQIPKTYADWAELARLDTKGSAVPLWRAVLPWSLLAELLSIYEFNAGSFDHQLKIYTGGLAGDAVGRGSHRVIKRLQSSFPLKGRTVIEFGPSDGNHTCNLMAENVAHVTAVEGRPENAVKLLVAKYILGWDNLDIVIDNFQALGPWACRRYDIAYAHGVYYHCQNPLVFLENLTRLSDAIFLGGWTATDRLPQTPWLWLDHRGERYRAKAYAEVDQFLAGLAPRSYMLDKEEIRRFFAGHGYRESYRDVEVRTKQDVRTAQGWVGGEFARMLFVKPA